MGGNDGTIIGRNLKIASNLSLSKSGKWKVKHGVALLCLLSFVLGAWFF